MNAFLAELLRFFNAVVAIVIVVFCTAAGAIMRDDGIGGALLGLAAGLLFAVIICGILATLIDIRSQLRTIAQNTAPKA
ncbi:MAG: hypothetical protein K1X51_11895 [Rhodospirillaceae bacterium]|nr:hypothetical protein [Rhodospirillaceae bacterium]